MVRAPAQDLAGAAFGAGVDVADDDARDVGEACHRCGAVAVALVARAELAHVVGAPAGHGAVFADGAGVGGC